MNFYIGNSIDRVNEQSANAEFSDELILFAYNLRGKVSRDMSKLYKIDPYSDVVVPVSDMPEIIEICNYLLNTTLLNDYNEPNEGRGMLKGLIQIAQNALSMNTGLVSIGD